MTASRAAIISRTLRNNLEQAETAAWNIDIDYNPQLIQGPFLKWLYAAVLNPKPTYYDKIFGAMGFAIGEVSTYSAYPLGSDFADIITSGATGSGADIFKVFCGITAFAPTAVLVALPTQSEFQKLAAILQKYPQLPILNDRPKKENSHTVRKLSGGIHRSAILYFTTAIFRQYSRIKYCNTMDRHDLQLLRLY